MNRLFAGVHRAVLVMVATCAGGCATLLPWVRPVPGTGTRLTSTFVNLHGRPLRLYLAAPATPTAGPLVLYASGDGGWIGTAVEMFRTIAANGYAAVGFSSRAFLRIERPRHEALSASQLAQDYAAILSEARRALALAPETPAVLSGWSRGAALAAIAGSERLFEGHLRGVIAIGLSADEDLKVNGGVDETDDDSGGAPVRADSALQPYARLLTLAPLRCAMIQATGDGYLPSASARHLFGADSPTRHFYEVVARNHRFSAGTTEFRAALLKALSWVAEPRDLTR